MNCRSPCAEFSGSSVRIPDARALLLRGLPVGGRWAAADPTGPVRCSGALGVRRGAADGRVRSRRSRRLPAGEDRRPRPGRGAGAGQEEFQGNAGSIAAHLPQRERLPRAPPRLRDAAVPARRPRGPGGPADRLHPRGAAAAVRGARRRCGQEFVTAPPPSFGMDGGAPHAVLTVRRGPGCPCRPGGHQAEERAPKRPTALQEHFDRTAQTHRLTPGDLAIVDNRVTVHGRTDSPPATTAPTAGSSAPSSSPTCAAHGPCGRPTATSWRRPTEGCPVIRS